MRIKNVLALILYIPIILTISACASHTDFNTPTPNTLKQATELLKSAPHSALLSEYAQKKTATALGGDPLCNATVLWEHQVHADEKIIYAHLFCQSVLLIDGDLRSAHGGIFGGPLFRLNKPADQWTVIDYDKRESPSIKPESWVAEYEQLVPEPVKVAYQDQLVHAANFVTAAAKIYQLDAPTYLYEFCSAKEPCAPGFICIEHGPSNRGQNKCVKACSTNAECGLGHTCRATCANGENGCPDTSVLACYPGISATR